MTDDPGGRGVEIVLDDARRPGQEDIPGAAHLRYADVADPGRSFELVEFGTHDRPSAPRRPGPDPYTGRYRQVRSPSVGRPTDGVHGAYGLFVWQDCAADQEAELDQWYDAEHIPLLMAVPGWLRSRRFTRRTGTGPRLLTIHELATLTVFDDDRYRAAVSTPWRNRVARHRRNRLRLVLRRLDLGQGRGA